MYRVLYRKWRPQLFDDVVGQDAVTKILRTQIAENKISHAYLFTGSRGTGKTTCAKLFAKAVNCLNPSEGNPCNKCELCLGADNGTLFDITEMDAASNRTIDDIRALREEVSFAPSKGRYRVYILDEVHMLTTEAFNALLKTLEEPPEHVIFILCTTEVHKLPTTILSRCQRFDFGRIESSVIASRLKFIAEQEEVKLSDDAAVLLARIADGGMRDALSLFDKCISESTDVTVDVVSKATGLASSQYLFSLMHCLAARDVAGCLRLTDEIHRNICDTQRLCVDLIEKFRACLICKTASCPAELIAATDEDIKELGKLSDEFGYAGILYAIQTLTSAVEGMKFARNKRIEAEIAFIKLCRPDESGDTSSLLARIEKLEREVSELKKNPPTAAQTVIRTPQHEPSAFAPAVPEFSGFANEKPVTQFASAFSGGAGDMPDDEDTEDFFNRFMEENSSSAETEGESADELQSKQGPVPPEVWKQVVLAVERGFKPFIGRLTGSSAYIEGAVLKIKPQNAIALFTPQEQLDKYVTPSVKDIIGVALKVQLI